MRKLFFIITFFSLNFFAKSQSITFNVVDENQSPLPGVNARILNSFKGTFSDENGKISLNNLKPNDQIILSMIGYYRDTVVMKENMNEFKIQLKRNIITTSEITVVSTRGNENAIASQTLQKEDLARLNAGQDMPFVLGTAASVVQTSDAGAGIGYTGIRIRGTDPGRINVTLNGVPLNDAESHGVWWVNMPDLASSLENVQIQRGVGTSGNGATSFGASINMQTRNISEKAFSEVTLGGGSFNTRRAILSFGTGLIGQRLSIEGKIAQINSDGFIDRGSTDLTSGFLSAVYSFKKTTLKFNYLGGKEKTFQSWAGVPEQKLRGSATDIDSYINNNYLDEEDANNIKNANPRTYNSYLYPNQTDNYRQQHFHFMVNRQINSKIIWNNTLHFTPGTGYYEEFRKNEALANYNLTNIPNFESITANLVRQRWLDNQYYGYIGNISIQHEKVFWRAGIHANQYIGNHFGQVGWIQNIGLIPQTEYYRNFAQKNEAGAFAKADMHLSEKLEIFLDLQYRYIDYQFEGIDQNLIRLPQSANFNFVNPKAGIQYKLNDKNLLFGYFGIAQREPTRDEFVNSTLQSRPKQEELFNYELGYKLQLNQQSLSLNVYRMDYNNQLVLSGAVNDVGAYIRQNVARSYRQGIEIQYGFKASKKINFELNATFSENKILSFNEYIDNFDDGSQLIIHHNNKDIAFSPNFISNNLIRFELHKNLELCLIGKFVGKQYLDNTKNELSKLDAYKTLDVKIDFISSKNNKKLNVGLLLNNVLNEEFESNGWTYPFIFNGTIQRQNNFYPQAPFHFLLNVSFRI
jgi:iron complex outermembrane receptor protein